MPRTGMEPIRRKALIAAAIEAIHDRGFRDVRVGDIARRAGVSSGLAHHYFGSKDDLLVAAMRYLLTDLGLELRRRLETAKTPRDRLTAVIASNFSDEQFRPAVISAWLAFYVQAQTSREARRLLRIYGKRLQSNLRAALCGLVPRPRAIVVAEGIAALIDGLWLRFALHESDPDQAAALALVNDYVDIQVEAHA